MGLGKGERTSVFCPAKVNLLLGVAGRRGDGFHDLLSVAAPLDFGDRLLLETRPEGEGDSLACDDPDLDIGPENLVLKAIRAYREIAPPPFSLRIGLEKNIPVGAGLGGGSSDAAGTLLALDQLNPNPVGKADLIRLASRLGSDVPLFLARSPVLMRGRGERIEPLRGSARDRITGQRLLLFAPEYSIGTVWAYEEMAKDRQNYISKEKIEFRLEKWLNSAQSLEGLLYNNFESVIFHKYLGIRALMETLRCRWQLPCLMSGSGSACFAILEGDSPPDPIARIIGDYWGPDAFIVECRLNPVCN